MVPYGFLGMNARMRPRDRQNDLPTRTLVLVYAGWALVFCVLVSATIGFGSPFAYAATAGLTFVAAGETKRRIGRR
jgi:hypothetical protein